MRARMGARSSARAERRGIAARACTTASSADGRGDRQACGPHGRRGAVARRGSRLPFPEARRRVDCNRALCNGARDRQPRKRASLQVFLCRYSPSRRNPVPRLLVIGGVAIALALFVTLLFVMRSPTKSTQHDAAILPPPWRIPINVLNGSGDINYTRQIASRIGAFGYTIKKVGRADNFTYPQTRGVLPAEMRGRRLPPGEAARRHDEAPPRWNSRRLPAVRNRRSRARAGRITSRDPARAAREP